MAIDIGKNVSENLPFILGAIAIVAVQYFLRKKHGPGGSQQDMVQNILVELKLDARMAEAFSLKWNTRTMMTTSWRLYREKLDFLPRQVQDDLDDTFELIEDYNQQMTSAKKFKTNSYMAGVDMDKLKPMLARCQEGLEQWLLLTTGSRNPPEKVSGMFDDLMGKR